MINIIPIIIDERGSVKKEIQILAMEDENLSKRFSILLPNSIKDKWLYIEFEKPDNTKFVTPRLTAVGNYIEYDITNTLTAVGKLVCQVVAKDGDNLVWKSNKFDFTISSSINATEEVAAQNPDILADLQSQIDDLDVDMTDYYTKTETNTLLGDKQNTLTAGTNITIENNVISATDETYTLPTASSSVLGGIKVGENLSIEDGVLSASGSSEMPIVELSCEEYTLEPNNHYVINGVLNSLCLTINPPVSENLVKYSFEFETGDRIPVITYNNAIAPYNYTYGKYKGYVCEIINTKVCIKTVYDAFPYQWIYGSYSTNDWTDAYTFRNDITFTRVLNGVSSSGTYQVELSNGTWYVYLTFADTTFKMGTYNNGTITIDGVVYTKS